jgi:hypothetical protein
MDYLDDFPAIAPALPVLTVSELNRMARRALESQLPLLWVEGEVSNFMRAASGHWYFSLKDAAAQPVCRLHPGQRRPRRNSRPALTVRGARRIPARRRGDPPCRRRPPV